METPLPADHETLMLQIQEHIKEIEFLRRVCTITTHLSAPLDQTMQDITDIIPCMFREPDHTCARVTVGSRATQTANSAMCRRRLETPITTSEGVAGVLEVGFFGAPSGEVSPILDEDRQLCQVIAARIGLIVQHGILRESLEQSEKRYRALTDNALVGVIQSTLKGDLLYFNNEGLRMFGYENLEEAKAAGTVSFYRNPENREKLLTTLVHAGRVSDYEQEYVTKTGESIFILVNVALDGEVITGMMMDITDRKRAEEALIKSERTLAKAQRIANVGSWEWDLRSGLVRCSDEAYRILGLEPEAGGLTSRVFFSVLHPEDRQKTQEAIDELLADRWKGEGLEIRIIRPDGSERTVYVQAEMTFDDNGKPVRMIGAGLDITERKRAEQSLIKSESRLVEAQRVGHVGSWEWDIVGGDLQWSDEVYRIFGFQPQQFRPDYKVFLAGIHPDDRQAVRETMKRSTTGLATPYSIEHRVIRPDGSERTVHGRGEVTFDREGKPVRMVGTVHDITDLKRAENEIRELTKRLEAENIYLREDMQQKEGYGDIIGTSDAIKSTMDRSRQVARTKTTVLLNGETGTGKGIFARYIHKMSDRRRKPFVNVNCAGLPASLIESELFGREKGAFTGSTERQIGRFELADTGTIFLDEIGELPLELQAKLLKVIEEGEFERLGSPHSVKVDVRVIASTNRNLETEIRHGRFRQDLFFRLNVFPITIPPLRERKGDVPLLVEAYAEKFSKSYKKKNIVMIPTNVMESLESYGWPGNVRELINVVERAVIVSDGPVLMLAEKMGTSSMETPPPDRGVVKKEDACFARYREEVAMREEILSVLGKTGWRIEGPKGAALLLGTNPSTLRTRMKKLGITRPGS